MPRCLIFVPTTSTTADDPHSVYLLKFIARNRTCFDFLTFNTSSLINSRTSYYLVQGKAETKFSVKMQNTEIISTEK